MTKEEAIYILRNTAFLAPSLEPIDEAIEMACEALRKTEPQRGYMWTCPICGTENHSDFTICPCCGEPKDEPTISKMEQVDKDINVRSKDESQTDNGIGCSRCEGRYDCYDRDMPHAVHCNNYGKDEQTDCQWK